MQTVLTLSTRGPGLYEFTQEVAGFLRGQGDGLVTLFCQHTSASLTIQENADPDVQRDLQAFFERLVPDTDHPSMSYLRHRDEGPDDMPAHIKSALTQVSLSIPVQSGRMLLGTWQGI
jgi:secondary thiamine-phosphate synthase enzyme